MACDLKKINWAVAIFYILFGVIGIVFTITFLAAPKTEEDWKKIGDKTSTMIIVSLSLIYCVLVFGGAISLMLGLKKNHPHLMKPLINIIYLGIVLTIAIEIRMLLWAIRKRKPLGKLALEILGDLFFCAFQGALLYPVYKLFRQMTKDNFHPIHHNEVRTLPQQQSAGNNTPFLVQQQTNGNDSARYTAEQQNLAKSYPVQNTGY